MKKPWGEVYKLSILGLSLLLLSCSPQPDRLERILQEKQLTVITRNAPTTWYEDREGYSGIEYDLIQHFANYLGVEAKFIAKDSVAEILEALKQGEMDIAAAGLTRTEWREDGFLFGPSYQQVKQQVVCRRGGPRPNDVADLAGIKLVVPIDSSYVETLLKFKQDFPQLQWKTDDTMNTENLLEAVWQKELDCTIADSNIIAINRRYFPELVVRFDFSEPEPLAWMLPGDATRLQVKIKQWFDEIKSEGILEALMDKYYGYIKVFDYVDTRTLTRRIEKVLPRYQPLFEDAAEQHGFDWTLLAAQAYQESHWNPRAKSPTGVRGIMMLTLTTARELGIKSRLNASQSIEGGAAYLASLRKRLPEMIEEEDRDWMALAAYNVGYGHLRDAFTLALRLEKNPYVWHELREVLPLLGRKKYYKTLRHGYARGWEPVRYVQRIRDYQDIIKQNLARKQGGETTVFLGP